ncbi:hypothetical protein HALLA_01395 (plasmid) [Halostagnicola larsenii XH-48]|uniref:Uncharacterized protein n=1 Tax=Halostagnicola larsenii XH-48 TaxID=797299 RepID=W0JTN9_9EURY|nr:hypothetical protein HALLA_01395 [Halostagnicola larsenii XH-48]
MTKLINCQSNHRFGKAYSIEPPNVIEVITTT